MADFYQILEIDRSADSKQLRASYKRLALLYHPDRNPGNTQAEEMFKVINEAYHVLSDPLKRARYDSTLYGYATYEQSEDYLRELQRQQFRRWQAAQRTRRYVFDREYFRIQGLAFLTFLIIASFCFGLIHTVNYIYELKRAEMDRINQALVMEVNSLFRADRLDEAFAMINKLRKDYPMEFRFYIAHDSLVTVVRTKAENEFRENNYSQSLHFLEVLQKEESPPRLETLRKVAVCEYQTGDFTNAIQTLKQIYSQQPWNLEILYQIGIINLTNLQDYEQALYYFTLGKKIFKENLTRIYGAAFEIVMNVEDVPDIYYEIFEARARTNLALEQYKEAETDCNWAIYLRPQKPDCYKFRVLAKVNQQINLGICTDLASAKRLGADGTDDLIRRYCR